MEGICTAGALEHVRVSYTRKHTGVLLRYTCRLCTTQRERCECVLEELVPPVVKIPLCCKDVPLHGVQRFRRSTRRWYAVRFEESEEDAAAEKEGPRTSEEVYSRHPQHAAEMSCDRRTSERKDAAAELKSPKHADTADHTGRTKQQRRKRSAVYPTRDRSRRCAVCPARVFACQGVVRSAV